MTIGLLKKNTIVELLKEDHERFRALFELGPIAVYTCDVAGKILDLEEAPVAGAEIVEVMPYSDPPWKSVSTTDGRFSLGGFAPGTRSVAVTATGFKKTRQELSDVDLDKAYDDAVWAEPMQSIVDGCTLLQ